MPLAALGATGVYGRKSGSGTAHRPVTGAIAPLLAAHVFAARALCAVEPPSAELWLLRDGADGASMHLTADQSEDVLPLVTAFFESCHTYASVVGKEPPPQELERPWVEHSRKSHLLVRMTGPPSSRHEFLRDIPFTLLLGLPEREGVGATLTRTDRGRLTSYAKCSGLAGLRLSCRIRSLNGPTPEPPDCETVRRIDPPSRTPEPPR